MYIAGFGVAYEWATKESGLLGRWEKRANSALLHYPHAPFLLYMKTTIILRAVYASKRG